MRCIAYLKVILEQRVRVCEDEQKAREWLQGEIDKEAHFMPYQNWKSLWAIFPFTKMIHERVMPLRKEKSGGKDVKEETDGEKETR